MSNITDQFIDKIYSLRDVSFSEKQLESVRKCLLDYCASIIGGAVISRGRIGELLATIKEPGEYSVVGHNLKVSLQTALLANGLESHVAELDDGVISGIIHPGAPILTALITYSELMDVKWNDFVLGVIAGYESACRLAEAIQPMHKKLGYHASATCGTIGVACGLAMMLSLSKEVLKEACSVALASSHGTLKVLEDASELKPYNIATAAINGVISVFMAKAGYKGANDSFSGEAGFLSQKSQNPDLSKLIGNRKALHIEEVYFKPYASCRYTHPAIEAGIKMQSLYDLDIEQIKEVMMLTYELAVKHHDHREIPNISSAKMSIPYGAAIGLALRNGGITSFTEEAIRNGNVQKIISKVKVGSKEEFSKAFPQKSMGEMIVRTEGERTFRVIIDYPKGEPTNPMSMKELEEKFRDSCRFANMGEDEIIGLVQSLRESEIDIKNIFNRLYKEF